MQSEISSQSTAILNMAPIVQRVYYTSSTHTPPQHTLTLGVEYLFSELHHVIQLWVNVLVSLLQHLHKLLSLFRILRCEVGVCGAGVLGTGGAADAVDIVLRVVGEVKVDHKFDVTHI